MRAIVETAILRCGNDVIEDIGQARCRLRQLQFPHAGRVEQPAALVQPMHFPHGRRMPPRIVGLSDRLGSDAVGASERVDERRFADARRAEQSHRLPPAAPGGQPCDAGAVARIDGFDHQPRL